MKIVVDNDAHYKKARTKIELVSALRDELPKRAFTEFCMLCADESRLHTPAATPTLVEYVRLYWTLPNIGTVHVFHPEPDEKEEVGG